MSYFHQPIAKTIDLSLPLPTSIKFPLLNYHLVSRDREDKRDGA